jgi:hypothetical protein
MFTAETKLKKALQSGVRDLFGRLHGRKKKEDDDVQ